MQEESVLIPKIEPENTVSAPVDTKFNLRYYFGRVPWRKVGIGFGAFLLVFIVAIVVPGFLLYQNGMKLVVSGRELYQAAKTQDISVVQKQIGPTKESLKKFEGSYNLVSWTKMLPFVGGYVSDLGHAIKAGEAGLDATGQVLTVIQPYADLLGLKGASQTNVLAASTSGEQTTQERIDFLVKTIPDILPKIDSISGNIKIMEDEISQINADRYPETYNGTPIRSKIKNGQDLVFQTSDFIVNGKPFLQEAPYLLGMDSPRTYLILFQNDKELRPTGGFMTAYAIMKVDKAKFEPVSSNDIYNLDALYKPSIPAPEPIIKYIKGPYILSQNLRLRDMNWSPDFSQSMDTFMSAASETGIKNVDGVIAVDTRLLENLLNVIGPIGVPGFGNFSTEIIPECNCAQVIHELESFADVEGPIVWDPVSGKIVYKPKNSDNRKAIIGPLMNSVLANALGQPKEKLAPLFEAGFKSLMEKHVLFYLADQTAEKAVSDFGVGGVIRSFDGDYLHINDANLGGRKSNLYATEDVNQDIEVAKDGSVTKTVTVTYKNPEKQDGWLNSILPTWVRVYVPKGSQLISADGLEAEQDPYEDLGKTVFAGYFELRPEGVSKVTFKYKLPFNVSKDYKLLIQKQPGTDGFLYTINLRNHTEEFYLKTDKEINISL